MFAVTEADAAAIRAVFEQRGEFAAAVELPAVPGHHRQRPGAGVRPYHRWLEAAAAAGGEANAETAAAKADVSDQLPGLAQMPSTTDVTPPPPGAWCRACQGTRWWTERHGSRGWRCLTCHPQVHLTAAAIRREGEAQ